MPKRKAVKTVYLHKKRSPFGTVKIGNDAYNVGKKGQRLIQVPEHIGLDAVRTYGRSWMIIEPDAATPIENAPLKPPEEHSTMELLNELTGRYDTPGLFMTDLRTMLIRQKGDVFPLTGVIADDEMIRELHTRGLYTVLNMKDFEVANVDLEKLRNEVLYWRAKYPDEIIPEAPTPVDHGAMKEEREASKEPETLIADPIGSTPETTETPEPEPDDGTTPEDPIDVLMRSGDVVQSRGWYKYKGESYRRDELVEVLASE